MNKNNADSNELTMLNHIKRLARGIKMVLDSMKIQPIDNVIAELNTLNTFVMCPLRKNRQKTYAKNRMKRMTNII